MRSHIQFGSSRIDFDLEFSERKSLGITVTPELKVLVKAPLNASVPVVQEKLRKKAPWIIKQKSYFISFYPKTPPRRFVSGETHLYLGRQYRLKIEESAVESVKLRGQFIFVGTPDRTRVKKLVLEWYAKNARSKFQSVSAPLIERFKKYGVSPSELALRLMPQRWGSCTPKGKIILNPELIKAPKGCIEYVIIHELCHLIHHDHTQRFLDLQSREIPSWEKWKSKLENLLA